MKKNTYRKPQKSKKTVLLKGKQGGRSILPTVLTDQELRVAGAFLPDLHRYPESHAHLHDLCVSMDEGVKQIKQGGVYGLGLPSSWGGLYSWAKQSYVDPVISYGQNINSALQNVPATQGAPGFAESYQDTEQVARDVSYFEPATAADTSGTENLDLDARINSLDPKKYPATLKYLRRLKDIKQAQDSVQKYKEEFARKEKKEEEERLADMLRLKQMKQIDQSLQNNTATISNRDSLSSTFSRAMTSVPSFTNTSTASTSSRALTSAPPSPETMSNNFITSGVNSALSLFQKATNYAWSWMAPYVEGASSYFSSLVQTVSNLPLGSILAYLTAGAIMAAAALYFYRKFKGKLTENDRKVGNVRSKLQNAIETWRKVSQLSKLYYIVDTTFESNWQKVSRDLRQWDSFFASSNLSDSSLLSEEEAATWLSKIAAVQSASEALLQQIQEKAKPKPTLIAPKIRSPTALYNVVVPSVSNALYQRTEEAEENAMLRNYLPSSAPFSVGSSVGSIANASLRAFQPPPVDVQSSLFGTNQRVSELQRQRLELEKQLREKQEELDLQIKRSKDLRYFESQEKEDAVAQQPRMGGSRRGQNK